MDILQCKEEKKLLEEKINKLLNEFESKFRVSITSVYLRVALYEGGGSFVIGVELDVKIPGGN